MRAGGMFITHAARSHGCRRASQDGYPSMRVRSSRQREVINGALILPQEFDPEIFPGGDVLTC